MKPPPSHEPSQGAHLRSDGVSYRTWCKHGHVAALIENAAGKIIRTVPLQAEGDGYFSALDRAGGAGDRYRYRFHGDERWPDPASRFQPDGVHGPSEVIDPLRYEWRDRAWQAPPFAELVVYELHLGTFTAAGTFQSAIERFDSLVDLGVNAIELMPVSDFPGARNWGYDGVMLYAPARCYGRPDDLRALVDAAHARGLAVILDVVYNHFGPDGNYMGAYHDAYVNPELHTPWGAALNYSEPAVRAFFVENAPYWRREFHIDGFRLDATHAIADRSQPHVLADITAAVHAAGGFVVAEDDRNEPRLLLPAAQDGCGMEAVWSDDFHHVVHARVTGEREGYYANFHGTAPELAETLTHGWLYRGQVQPSDGRPRGGDTSGFVPPQFIFCISNHDQVGNRALGERLGHLVTPAAYRAVSALLCLVPQTPLLFQGQEWAASTPFQYFTDHNPELGRLVTEGRRQEFGKFAAFRDPARRAEIPDPQAEATFLHSKLRWEERHDPAHAGILRLYRECIALRKQPPWRALDRRVQALAVADGIVAFQIGAGAEAHLIATDLVGGHAMPDLPAALPPPPGRQWKIVLSSNEARFGGERDEPFAEPTTLVFSPQEAREA